MHLEQEIMLKTTAVYITIVFFVWPWKNSFATCLLVVSSTHATKETQKNKQVDRHKKTHTITLHLPSGSPLIHFTPRIGSPASLSVVGETGQQTSSSSRLLLGAWSREGSAHTHEHNSIMWNGAFSPNSLSACPPPPPPPLKILPLFSPNNKMGLPNKLPGNFLLWSCPTFCYKSPWTMHFHLRLRHWYYILHITSWSVAHSSSLLCTL